VQKFKTSKTKKRKIIIESPSNPSEEMQGLKTLGVEKKYNNKTTRCVKRPTTSKKTHYLSYRLE